MIKSDQELIADYQNGDTKAFEMLFERYKTAILNFALRIVGNRADAEDVVSEVMTILLVKKDAYRPIAKFSTWIFTIARNSCVNKLRKQKNVFSLWMHNNQSGEYEMLDVADQEALADHQIKDKEVSVEVRKAIEKLPETQREAIVLREYQNLSYEEISQILGCSLENVKVLIFRARERLRQELSSFMKEGSE
jgi:RNA polymerase sigma-70 factor (ECF subfamily)